MAIGCGKLTESDWTGLLTATGEGIAAPLREHLEGCGECRSAYAEWRQFERRVRRGLTASLAPGSPSGSPKSVPAGSPEGVPAGSLPGFPSPALKEAFVNAVLADVRSQTAAADTPRRRGAAEWLRGTWGLRFAAAASVSLVLFAAALSGLFPFTPPADLSIGFTVPGGTILRLSEEISEPAAVPLTTRGVTAAATGISPGTGPHDIEPAGTSTRTQSTSQAARPIRTSRGVAQAAAVAGET